ncbi:MAG: energy-coupling factor ABC transporter ATP-binding protein [Anaerovoracaceae bacterium]
MSIEVEQVTFRYLEQAPAVLRDFSASFADGRITAVVGNNGCGKTTLSRLILGILRPQQGRITVDGTPAADLSLAEMGRRIGYVMQNPARQIFSTSVREEMLYGLHNLGLDGAEAKRRAAAYLERFDLAGREEEFPFDLSHGEKQRLVLAAVLAMQPRWLMLDEPTAALDYGRRDRLCEYLLELKKERACGVLLISHDRRFIERCADEVLRIEDGRAVPGGNHA